MNIIQQRFQKARKFLGLSKNAAAKNAGLTHTAVNQFEKGISNRPNFDYLTYLIKQGINPYFLIGESEEVEGQNLEEFISKNKYDKLEAKYEELQSKFENMEETLQLLQIEVDENGNLKKRDSNI